MAKNEIKESLTDIKSVANDTIKVVKDLNKSIKSMNATFEGLFDDLSQTIEKSGRNAQKNINKYYKYTLKDTEKTFDDIISKIIAKTKDGTTSISKIVSKSFYDNMPKEAINKALYENTIGSFLSKKGFSSFSSSWYETLSQNKFNKKAYNLGMEAIENDGTDELKEYNEMLSKIDDEIVSKQMELNKLRKQHKKSSPTKAELENLLKERSSVTEEKELVKAEEKKALTKSFKSETSYNLTKMATSFQTDLVKVGIDAVKKLGKAIVKTFKEAYNTLLDTATYSTSTSLITNSSAREQQLTYGLSESQNYAFTQTKSLLGISSDEDLYYMNENQRAMFSKLMSKQLEFYEDMNQNGSLQSFQEMQIDIKILKQEFMSKIVQFIAKNKDAIYNFIESGLTILSNLLDGVSNILSFLGYSKEETAGSKTSTLSTSEIQDLFNSKYSNTSAFDSTSVSSLSNNIDNSNNSSKVINVNINNNANLSSSKEASSVANQLSESSLKSLMTYFES